MNQIIWMKKRKGYIIFQTKRLYITTELVPMFCFHIPNMFPQCSHNVSISFPSHSHVGSPVPHAHFHSHCMVQCHNSFSKDVNVTSFFLFAPSLNLSYIIMAILVMRTFILPQEVPNANLMMIHDIY
jgi:hypothetical protein